jgi:predicted RNA binding protein YcfA (HicA-like mRNA interferase family)
MARTTSPLSLSLHHRAMEVPSRQNVRHAAGKGSYRNYSHPLVAKVVTVFGRDGDDARRHLEKTVQRAINEVNQWRKATDT